MIINNLKELEQRGVLVVGDQINFYAKKDDGWELYMEYAALVSLDNGIHLSNLNGENAKIFDNLGLNTEEFCRKAYGYYSSGHDIFPAARAGDWKAITNVVRNLYIAIDGEPEEEEEETEEETDRFSLMDFD